MKLPLRLPWDKAQDRWSTILTPVVECPLTQGQQLKNVSLVIGVNTINHGLGRELQGWFPVRWHGSAATLYDLQDVNQMPELTLKLNASASVLVDIYVY